MRDCQQVLVDLFAYLDQEMNEADAADVRAHIELCRVCFDRLEFERLLRDHFRDKTKKPCPEELKKRIQKLIESY